ncbi:hypothetical protein SCOR_07860 [Sulfidibacter corallicola]
MPGRWSSLLHQSKRVIQESQYPGEGCHGGRLVTGGMPAGPTLRSDGIGEFQLGKRAKRLGSIYRHGVPLGIRERPDRGTSNCRLSRLAGRGIPAVTTALSACENFGHDTLRKVHPADVPTGHRVLSRHAGTPSSSRFEVSGRRPNLPRRRLSQHAGTLGTTHFEKYIQRMYLLGSAFSLGIRELPVRVASKCRAGGPTYRDDGSLCMRELWARRTSKSTSSGCTYWAPRSLSAYGNSQFESLRSVGPAAQPTATTALSACGNFGHDTLRKVHPADVPTGHHVLSRHTGTPNSSRFEVSGRRPNPPRRRLSRKMRGLLAQRWRSEPRNRTLGQARSTGAPVNEWAARYISLPNR